MIGHRAILALLLAAGAARAESRALATGVDESPRRGAWLETTLGAFSTLGGSARVSSVQPYLGLTVGHDVGARSSLFVSLGMGASSASCYTGVVNGVCGGSDSFGAAFLELGGAYGMPLADRTLLSFKLVAGLTDLSPSPIGGSDHLFGVHGGGGVALDYATRLDHFAVGIDALVRYTLARGTPQGEGAQTLGVPSVALMPRVRYTF